MLDKKLPEPDKVIHVAFGCGCVQSFLKGQQVVMPRCPRHGDHQVSATEELVPLSAA